jgi:outer membrane protein assembly factor BamB
MSLKVILLLVVLLCITGVVFGQLQDGPWPKVHRDMANTSRSNYSGPITSDLKWTYQTGGDIATFPAVAEDGTIYFVSSDDYLYALNPDGSFKWSYPTGGLTYGGPAIGIDGTIYMGSNTKTFFAFRQNGTVKWTYETNNFLWLCSPNIGQDGTIYIGDYDGNLYALDSDGNEKWTFPNGSDFQYPAIGTDGTIYIGDRLRYLTSIYPTTGQQKWRYDLGYAVSPPAIGPDGTIYVTKGWPQNDSLFAINPSGTLKWVIPVDIGSISAIDSDGNIYLGSYESPNFNTFDSSGSLLWSFTTHGGTFTHSSAIDASGRVYFATWTGPGDTLVNRVYALNPDGSLLWSRGMPDAPRYSPAIGLDSTLYIGCADGKLYAFGTPTTGTEEKDQFSVFRFQLLQNRPNPFFSPNKGTVIRYGLAKPGDVSLKVYDITGRLVKTLVAGEKKAGMYSVPWDGKDSRGMKVSSGIYFYRLHSGDFTATKKLTLLR